MSLEIAIMPWDVDPTMIYVHVTGHKFGPFSIAIGGASTTEFVYLDGNYTYRGRPYFGRILLRRVNLSVAPGYAWELKNPDGTPVSWPVFKAISNEILGTTLDVLRDHPEIYIHAEYASLKEELARAVRLANRLFNEYNDANLVQARLSGELSAYETDHKEVLAQ